MNVKLCVFILLFLLHNCNGVIYNLNKTEYQRMPPIYRLDSYKSCLQSPNDVYCTLYFDLVSDEPNDLLRMIQEYSEHSKTHFDHRKLRYGVCVTRNCQNHIRDNISVSEKTLEGCLNQSLWDNYQLKTRLQDYTCYNLSDHKMNIDTSDVVAGIIVFTILMLCLIGSLYDIYYKLTKREGNPVILSFSLRRSFKSLFLSKRNEMVSEDFKSLNGLRCIISFGVIMVHCNFVYFIIGKNIHDVELSYYSIFLQLIYNGPLMMQGLFVISGFLLAYKTEVLSEKHDIGWAVLPLAIFKRYLRLTPAYAVVVLYMTTWFKFQGPGPVWKLIGEAEVLDCKKRWWMNLLFINNYVYNYECLPTSWSLATDMQLYCFGLVLIVLFRRTSYRNTILTCLFVIGSVILAIHTYLRNLNVAMFFEPSVTGKLFVTDFTFNETYKMAHGNLSSYITGLALGYFIYRCQQEKELARKYLKYKYVYWLVFPAIVCAMLSQAIFYRDGPKESLCMRVVFSIFTKPMMGVLIAALIAGLALKLENVYRKFLEWDIWTIPSKLTYGAYLVHLPHLFIYINQQQSLLHMSIGHLLQTTMLITMLSFVTAIPLYLFVEAPFMDLLNRVKVLPKKATLTNGYKKTE